MCWELQQGTTLLRLALMDCEILGAIANVCTIVEIPGVCLLRHLNYVFKIRSALQDAESKVLSLQNKRDDLQSRVDRDVNLVNYMLKPDVPFVLKQLGDAILKFENLKADILRDTHDTDFFWSVSFSKVRVVHGHGKTLSEFMTAVQDLLDKPDFDDVVIEMPPRRVVELPTVPSQGMQITVGRALDRIKDETVSAIGIYGMGGIGKTTILKEINNSLATSANEFDFVIWVYVSRHVDHSEILNCIGKRIGLCRDFETWKEQSLEDRSLQIWDILKNKTFVLLLDDVWERIDLTKLGIPFLEPSCKSKVVLTSRQLRVCERMGAQERIKVECLGKNDSWTLFSNKVGEETINAHPEIHALAEEICDRCSGFPLLLSTLGCTMAYQKTTEEWKFMLTKLKKNVLQEEDVLATLRVSYDFLKDETTKSCFLYLCFSVRTYEWHWHDEVDLVQQWFAIGLLGDDYEYALMKGSDIIRQLQHSSLCDVVNFEEDIHQVQYKMHDVIVEMGQQVVIEGRNNLCKNFPPENYSEVEHIFIRESGMEELPEPPICPTLSTLVICQTYLKIIHEGFSNSVSQLRVLSLYGCCRLRSLPNGINLLTKLRYLNIGDTSIKICPENFQELKELQIIRLNCGLRLPPGFISNFKKLLVLEYLEDHQPLEVLKELDGLPQLYDVVLPPFECLSETFYYFIRSKKLLKCTSRIVLVGKRYEDESAIEEYIDTSFLKHMIRLKSLMLSGFDNQLIIPSSPSECTVFKSIVSFVVTTSNRFEDISHLLISMPYLEYLALTECDGMKSILKKEQIIDVNTRLFGRLQTMLLYNMSSLDYISSDKQQFPHLQCILVGGCPRLHNLPFNATNAGQLRSIKGSQKWFDELQWENEESRLFASDKFQMENLWDDFLAAVSLRQIIRIPAEVGDIVVCTISGNRYLRAVDCRDGCFLCWFPRYWGWFGIHDCG